MSEKIPSPEEIAKIEKERTISDAELLKGGAEYEINESGEKILEPTREQLEKIKNDKNLEEDLDRLKKMFEEKKIKKWETYPFI